MKYISFTVPCFNSQEYMRKCIDSLLKGGSDVEIIIINDGSKDGTLEIANEYLEKYPDIVRVVDKENGGHGSGVNAGLARAEGLYFKVVDSDDWVDEQALYKLLETIKLHSEAHSLPDMYVVNYVYEHIADNTRHYSRFNKIFPEGVICGWNKTRKFRYSLMLLMHALVYKTSVLKESGLVLPEHTFYVDDIYSYNPLPYVKSLCYLNIDFYRYFIGRADQSVNIVNMLKRYEQQIRVMTNMTDRWTYKEICSQGRRLKKYMFHALENYMLTTVLFVCGADAPERREAYRNMWRHIREKDKKLYRKLRYRTVVFLTTGLPWKMRGAIHRYAYKILCKRIKLG